MNSFEDRFRTTIEKRVVDSQMSLKAVIAIDFGTSRSGYAYALSPVDIREEEAITFKKEIAIVGRLEWPGCQDITYIKSPTEILYSSNHEVAAWGYEAKSTLADLRQNNSATDYYLLKEFKMELLEGEVKSDAPILRNSKSEELLVSKVIADYLRELKDLAREDISKATVGTLRDEEILWCLTVPAIWKDSHKQMMRQSAMEAGLISSSDEEERLLLVSEPEAAAIYCQESEAITLKDETQFMILDCGGGTVDITLHRVEKGELDEAVTGGGAPLGSTKVDKAFRNYLSSKFTHAAIKSYHEKEPLEYLRSMAEWERIKCNFDPLKTERTVFFPLFPKFKRILESQYEKELEDLEHEQSGDLDSIHLSYQKMMNIFSPITDNIINEVEIILNKLERTKNRKCKYIYMVGGFSQSILLQQKVREKFENKKVEQVIVPRIPSEAVVKGAVSFGLNPSAIRSRRSRLTYGCAVNEPFIVGVDLEEKKYYDNYHKADYCKNRFSVFVLAGQSIETDEKIIRTFCPGAPNQTSVKFRFYATESSDEKNIRYVDQKGLFKVGELTISTPDTTGGMNRTIEVTMYFGKTEIKALVVDKTSGNQCQTSLLFFSTYSPELINN